VVGSNISNVLLILGITAWLYPISVEEKIATKDSVLLLSLMVLFMLVSFIFPLTRGVALFFVVVTCVYVAWLHKKEKDSNSAEVKKDMKVAVDTNEMHFVLNIAMVIVGLVGLFKGSNLLVESAVEVARFAGMSEAAIGLTFIAVGTSLPELVSSVMSARAGKPGMALGNVIGSNMFNVFGILGIVGLFAPSDVPDDIRYVYSPLMLVVTAVLVYLMRKHRVLSQKTGQCFVGAFAGYTTLLMIFG
jgi:cation:H+ antiporter